MALNVICFLLLLSFATGHDELSQIMQDIGTNKYLLLLVPRLGLANRLRSIADWYSIASNSGRTLLVSWEVSRECNAKFSDFFSLHTPNIVFLDQPIQSSVEGVNLAGSIAETWNITYNLKYEYDHMWASGYSSFILARSLVDSETQLIITNYDGILSMEGSCCTTYLDSVSQFFANLIPMQSATDFVNAAVNMHFADSVMVGVHYRAHDSSQDWAVVPPLLGDPSDKAFGEGATIDDFISAMRKIEAAVIHTDTDGNVRTNVRFFLASNSAEAKSKIAEAFPTAVVLYGDHDRESGAGMQLAFYEWLMLSRSALILHTYGSTFADMAARARMIPIVGIWEGKLLHHSSTALPFCGSLDFSRSYGVRNKKGKYQRGANTDNSEMEAVFLPMQYTDALNDWGLTEVLTLGGPPESVTATEPMEG